MHEYLPPHIGLPIAAAAFLVWWQWDRLAILVSLFRAWNRGGDL